MNITVYTDGGSLNNPGEAATAFLIYKDSKEISSSGKKIGIATNNTAEYKALIFALERLIQLSDSNVLRGVQKISAFSDSELMIRQINGEYKVKHPEIKILYAELQNLKEKLAIPVIHIYTPRENNTAADALVKKTLGR